MEFWKSRLSPALVPVASTVLLLGLASLRAEGFEHVSLKSAYRFDGMITHGWEHRLWCSYRFDPSFALTTDIDYVDATQDPVAGIVKLRGQVVSAQLGLQWRTPRNHVLIDAAGGIDGVLDWHIKPRGALKIDLSVPIPANRLIQHVKLTPEGWYTHAKFNGPAVKNKIASYGFSCNLGWIMGPNMAAAVNYRQEYLRPDHEVLDTAFTSLSTIAQDPWVSPLAHDTLRINSVRTFYAYVYRRILNQLTLGYSFSYSDMNDPRTVYTRAKIESVQGIPPVTYARMESAQYPYPAMHDLLSHAVALGLNLKLRDLITWKSNASIPFYSRQTFYAMDTVLTLPQLYELPPNRYTWKPKFSAPMTFQTEARIIRIPTLAISLGYEYFGFAYKEWAYFTKYSYSLHTISLTLEKRF